MYFTTFSSALWSAVRPGATMARVLVFYTIKVITSDL